MFAFLLDDSYCLKTSIYSIFHTMSFFIVVRDVHAFLFLFSFCFMHEDNFSCFFIHFLKKCLDIILFV